MEYRASRRTQRQWTASASPWTNARLAASMAWLWGPSRTSFVGCSSFRRIAAQVNSNRCFKWYASAQGPDATFGRRGRPTSSGFPKKTPTTGSSYDRRGTGNHMREDRLRNQRDKSLDLETVLTPLQEKLRSGHDFLYGLAPVLGALTACRRANFYELFILDRPPSSDDMNRMIPRKAAKKAMEEQIVERARQLGIAIRRVDKGTLNTLCGNRPHQGFVLECATMDFVPMKPVEMFLPTEATLASRQIGMAMEKSMQPCWLALDEVWDPQNLGALLRSAYFFGCDGVMLTKKNSAGLTATVSKASSGAMEFMDVHAVSNMPQYLETAHRLHGWRILGATLPTASMSQGAKEPEAAIGPTKQVYSRRGSACPLIPCADLTLLSPTILVLGNEGHGLRTNVERVCTAFTYIECDHSMRMGSSMAAVDSLNVSVAGAILMHRLMHGRS
ncbi:Ribose methyltransferase [Cyanidiococcus yangmingshanensis]|uniref:rRNA methyltransferase 1, mitochondrial n=1 Tax=Cyanidiococcus yangmingshanensis TaxID=2690220 RepID=A0A7J7IES0_9RHOD|nr:Ribose methyltransferase [Cyanidiococcus yangmingshanensis]